MSSIPFRNRQEAGDQLARLLLDHQHNEHSVILSISSAAIPIAISVARQLKVCLDLQFVKAFTIPGLPAESGGAITCSGEPYLYVDWSLLDPGQAQVIRNAISIKQKCLERTEQRYRNGRTKAPLRGKNVIIIGDGSQRIASIMATIQSVKKQLPRSVTVATPMTDIDTLDAVRMHADRVVCLTVNKYYPSLFDIYPSDNAGDIFNARHLIRDFWKSQPAIPHKSSRKEKPTNHVYFHYSEITRDDWQAFAATFSEQYTGWKLSARIMKFEKQNGKQSSRFFLSKRLLKNSPFIGMAYIEQQRMFCIRHISQGRISVQQIEGPIRLTFRDSANNRKSIRIDTEEGESFYIQVMQESQLRNEASPAHSKSVQPMIAADGFRRHPQG